MPQIGWFELLVIVVIAILVIGPKKVKKAKMVSHGAGDGAPTAGYTWQ